MQIDHVSFSRSGGAGKVASLLSQGLKQAGLDSRFNPSIESSLWLEPWKSPSLTLRSAVDRYVFSRSTNLPLFSRLRRDHNSDLPIVRNGSVLHLHWIEGVVSPARLNGWLESGRNIVWTLHDMAPFTGGCHQSLGCALYETGCYSCPQVRKPFKKAVALEFSLLRPLSKYSSQIILVAPSNWLANKARTSPRFAGLEVKVINNPVDQVFFEKLTAAPVREELGIPSGAFVGISVAAQLDDPSKNIDSAITSFLGGEGANTGSRHVILVGQGGKAFAKKYRNVHLVGSGDSAHVARHISASDLLVVTSKAESAGLTIQEAATQRVPAAILSNGGSDEFIAPNESGYIATNLEELSELIDNASKDFVTLRLMGDRAFERVVQTHRLDTVVGQYLSIYNWLVGLNEQG